METNRHCNCVSKEQTISCGNADLEWITSIWIKAFHFVKSTMIRKKKTQVPSENRIQCPSVSFHHLRIKYVSKEKGEQKPCCESLHNLYTHNRTHAHALIRRINTNVRCFYSWEQWQCILLFSLQDHESWNNGRALRYRTWQKTNVYLCIILSGKNKRNYEISSLVGFLSQLSETFACLCSWSSYHASLDNKDANFLSTFHNNFRYRLYNLNTYFSSSRS